jgi:hypothetical protein
MENLAGLTHSFHFIQISLPDVVYQLHLPQAFQCLVYLALFVV